MKQNNQNNQANYYQQGAQHFSGHYYQPPVATPQYEQHMLLMAKQKKQKNELIKTGIIVGAAIIIYLVAQVLAATVLDVLKLRDLYNTSPVFQSCFSIIGVHILSILLPFGVMALILRKRFTGPVIPAAPVKKMTVFSWVSCGMVWCLGANILVNIVINIVKEMGYELTQGEVLKPDSAFACIMLVFSVSVIPGIIEEFAMRCCTLGVLKKYGAGFATLAVSVVFGLLHGNVIQFLYAFLVGLFLAYITINTGSVVPAMLVHAFANGLSVVSDVVTYATNKKTAEMALSGVIIFWTVSAVIGLIYLVFKKEILPKKDKFAKQSGDTLSFGTKLACLIPGFLVPFVLLLVLTATTIHKI